MTQVPLMTGKSDPSRGLLKVQGSQRSCSRDHQPHESGPTRGQLRTRSSQGSCNRGHQRHEGGPTKRLPMVTQNQSHKSGPIRG